MSIENAADDAARKASDVAQEASDQARDLADGAADTAKGAADHVSGRVQDAVGEVQEGHGVVNRLHRLGFRSEYAYVGAFASIGLSLTTWFISRNKTGDDKGQSDRWGIFIGHWAPTFMALGVALKLEEER